MSRIHDAYRVMMELSQRRKIFRVKDFVAYGLSPEWLGLMVRRGHLSRREPGVFLREGYAHEVLRYPTAICAGVRWPSTVIHGLSALHVAELCGEPPVTWLAIDAHARAPKSTLPMKLTRVRELRFDPDVTFTALAPLVRTFSVARALVDSLRDLEHGPFPLIQTALCTALDRGKTSPEGLLEVARRRGCARAVREVMEVVYRPGLATPEPPPPRVFRPIPPEESGCF